MVGKRMKRTVTTLRCVPRYGYEHTQVRTVDLDLSDDPDVETIRDCLCVWFAQHGIADAVYDIDVADDGFFAIVNDDVFQQEWGEPLL